MMTAAEKRAARRAKEGAGVDMNLVSLIDVFTILIFFLLVQMGPAEILSTNKAVKLPASTADKAPRETVVLVVAGDDLIVEGRKVASVAEVAALREDLIAPLKAELDLQGQRVAVKKENQKATHAVTILADKDIPYNVLKKVMVTCAQANFGDVSFAVRQRDGKADA